MTKEELKTILENHKHWINEDVDGWECMCANLRGADLSNADLRGADLRYANLSNASLSDANLRYADLSNADLSDADLSYANLSGANLSNADLCNADLRDANLRYASLSNASLRDANLRYANLSNASLSDADLSNASLRYADLSNASLSNASLRYADLSNASLRYADLSNASLRDANLRYANLCDADLSDAENVPYIPMVCPEEGKFIGWKKAVVQGEEEENHYRKVIVKLEIPASAKRFSATTRKCRCDKAKVLEIFNLDGTVAEERKCYSSYDNDFIYEVGKTVKVDDFNEDRWNECSQGIHFFINRQEAINY